MWPSLVTLGALLLLAPLSSTHPDTPAGGKGPVWNMTWTDRLKGKLLLLYDKFSRPAQHYNTTRVNIDMVFRHVHLDDIKSLLTVNGWVRLSWEDEKLQWNASEYGGLTTLHLGDHEIWEPDITLYNSAIGNSVDHYGNTFCLVREDGTVLWVPPAQFATFCEMDLERWPYDQHTCSIRLGSWTYSGEQIDLVTNESAPTDVNLDVSEWEVVSVNKKRSVTYYPCCEEPYMDVEYNLTLSRKASSFQALILNPAIVVVILSLSVFWLPPQASEKFLVAATALILICIYLVYFSYRLPAMGLRPPLIVRFYSTSLVLVAVSLVISVCSHNVSRLGRSRPLPWALAGLLSGPLATLLWLPPHKRWERGGGEELRDRAVEDTQEESSMLGAAASRDWLLLAVALDRIAFCLYLLFFGSIALGCFL